DDSVGDAGVEHPRQVRRQVDLQLRRRHLPVPRHHPLPLRRLHLPAAAAAGAVLEPDAEHVHGRGGELAADDPVQRRRPSRALAALDVGHDGRRRPQAADEQRRRDVGAGLRHQAGDPAAGAGVEARGGVVPVDVGGVEREVDAREEVEEDDEGGRPALDELHDEVRRVGGAVEVDDEGGDVDGASAAAGELAVEPRLQHEGDLCAKDEINKLLLQIYG
ncbi:Os10g0389402, partial [Oryza sativa Japonica Group]